MQPKVRPNHVKSGPHPENPIATAFALSRSSFLVHISCVELPQPLMNPAPGERLVRFVGDKVLFTLRPGNSSAVSKNWQARLRTNLGRAAVRRREIIAARA